MGVYSGGVGGSIGQLKFLMTVWGFSRSPECLSGGAAGSMGQLKVLVVVFVVIELMDDLS